MSLRLHANESVILVCCYAFVLSSCE